MGRFNLNYNAVIEVPKTPHVGVLAAPGAEFHGDILVFLTAAAELRNMAVSFFAPVIVPLLASQPLCPFEAELVMEGVGLAHMRICRFLVR